MLLNKLIGNTFLSVFSGLQIKPDSRLMQVSCSEWSLTSCVKHALHVMFDGRGASCALCISFLSGSDQLLLNARSLEYYYGGCLVASKKLVKIVPTIYPSIFCAITSVNR